MYAAHMQALATRTPRPDFGGLGCASARSQKSSARLRIPGAPRPRIAVPAVDRVLGGRSRRVGGPTGIEGGARNRAESLERGSVAHGSAAHVYVGWDGLARVRQGREFAWRTRARRQLPLVKRAAFLMGVLEGLA